MSSALLKRSLQLVEESLNDAGKSSKSKAPLPSSKKQSKSSTAFDLIPQNQRIIKISKDKKTQAKTHTDELRRKQKIDIKQAKNRIDRNKSKASENVQKLLKMQRAVNLSEEATETLMRRARSQRYVIPEQKPAEESTTAFTEEDFLKFEKEYFVN